MTDINIRQFKERFINAFNRKVHSKSLANIINRFHDKVFAFDGFNVDELKKFKDMYPEVFRLIERKCNTYFY